jgi:hypothetical protein
MGDLDHGSLKACSPPDTLELIRERKRNRQTEKERERESEREREKNKSISDLEDSPEQHKT